VNSEITITLQLFKELISTYIDDMSEITGDYLLGGDQNNINQKTLGLSSLEIVELIIDIESKYKITITEDEIHQIKTINDMMRLINEEVQVQKSLDIKREETKKLLFG